MAIVTLQELIEAGVHFGHRCSRWNPKMQPYIYGKRNQIHIIDLRQTVRGLLRGVNFLERVSASGGEILFVGTKPQVKELVGVDVFLDWSAGSPAELGDRLRRCGDATLPLEMITNRGVRVWPQGLPETFCTDHWRCRFRPEGGSASWADVLALLGRLSDAGFEVIKLENLYTFDGRPGFSLGQGQ